MSRIAISQDVANPIFCAVGLLYYWSDLTEIFTQYVKSEKKHLLFLKRFPFRA